MKIIERFRNEKLAVNCYNEKDAKEFISICFDNNMTWKYFSKERERTFFTKGVTTYAFNHYNLRSLNYTTDYNLCDDGYEILAFREFKQLLKEEENLFTKDMLNQNIGMHITIRNGDTGYFDGNDLKLTKSDGGHYSIPIENYRNSLKYRYNSSFDIVEIIEVVESVVHKRQEKSQEELEQEKQIAEIESFINDLSSQLENVQEQLGEAQTRLKNIRN